MLMGEYQKRLAADPASSPVFVISDEPYRRISYMGPARNPEEGKGDSLPSVMNCYAYTFIVSSFSKDLSLPGERIGWVAMHPCLYSPELQASLTVCSLLLYLYFHLLSTDNSILYRPPPVFLASSTHLHSCSLLLNAAFPRLMSAVLLNITRLVVTAFTRVSLMFVLPQIIVCIYIYIFIICSLWLHLFLTNSGWSHLPTSWRCLLSLPSCPWGHDWLQSLLCFISFISSYTLVTRSLSLLVLRDPQEASRPRCSWYRIRWQALRSLCLLCWAWHLPACRSSHQACCWGSQGWDCRQEAINYPRFL